MLRNIRNSAALRVAGTAGVAVVLLGGGLHFASADDSGAAKPVSVSCPTVADKLGEVPAAARAGVDRELRNLENQIAAVNARLAREPKQAANQLNDIAGKRRAVLDRIRLNITRVGGTAPAGLEALATCAAQGGAAQGGAAGNAGQNGGAQNGTGQNGGAQSGGGQAAPAGAQTVNCPGVADRLPAVPPGAQAEVQRELGQLDKQIAEANARLARLAVRPEGGPNFVRNAILGPLEDRRVAVLNRIATAIGRVNGDRPAGLDALAPCTLNT